MSAEAGGAGLGLVAGWTLGGKTRPTAPGPLGAVLAALVSLTALSAVVGNRESAAAFIAAAIVSYVIRRSLVAFCSRGARS